MGANLGSMSAKCGINADEYLSGLKKMQSETDKSLAGIKNSFASLKSQLSGGFAGALAGGSLGAGLQSAVSLAKELGQQFGSFVASGRDAIANQDRLTRQLGVTRDAAVSLAAIGRSAGLDPATMGATFADAQRHIGTLRQELAGASPDDQFAGGSQAMALRRLGLDARQFATSSFDQQLTAFGSALRDIANAEDRAAIGAEVFGRRFNELAPFLRESGESFQRIRQYAVEFGAVARDDTAASVRGTAEQMRELRIASDLANEGLRVAAYDGFMRATTGANSYAESLQRLREMQPTQRQLVEDSAELSGNIMSIARAGPDLSISLFGWLRRSVSGPEGIAPRGPAMEVFNPGQAAPAQNQLSSIAQLRIDIDRTASAIHRQNEEFGLSADEIKRMQLVQRGATAEMLAGLDREIQATQRLRVEQQALAQGEAQMAEVRRMATEARSPAESFQSQVDRIMGAGLNSTQRAAHLGRLVESTAGGIGNLQLPSLMERGSVEAISTLNSAGASMSTDPLNRLQEAARRSAEEFERIIQVGRRFEQLLGGFVTIIRDNAGFDASDYTDPW
jgi:hypothetical protein